MVCIFLLPIKRYNFLIPGKVLATSGGSNLIRHLKENWLAIKKLLSVIVIIIHSHTWELPFPVGHWKSLVNLSRSAKYVQLSSWREQCISLVCYARVTWKMPLHPNELNSLHERVSFFLSIQKICIILCLLLLISSFFFFLTPKHLMQNHCRVGLVDPWIKSFWKFDLI